MMHPILEKFSLYSDRVSVIDMDKEFTYSALIENIKSKFDQVSGAIPQNEVVILRAGYNFESISLLFALAFNRNIIVPVTDIPEQEANLRRDISAATHEITVSADGLDFRKLPEPNAKNPLIAQLTGRDHPGIILFSSGITGEPKGMVHDLQHLLDSYLAKKSKSLSFLALLLFDHIGGLNTMFTALFSGARLIISPSRDPEMICQQCEKHRVNILPASPTMLNLILISGSYRHFDLSSVKIITYGTEPMPEGLLLKLNEALPGTRFMQTYGTSETGISKMSSKSSTSLRVKFDDPDTQYKIVNGELWIKSATTIMGYLNAPMDRFTEDGWFKTGDLVDMDEEGYLYFTGRNNEIINVGGLKVLPQEVESVLMKIPVVDNCVVYAEKSPITGNIVAADIQLKKGTMENEARQVIRDYCRENLDRYKIPVKIYFVEAVEFNDRFKKIRKS
ncbi:MAG TPA: fatty acid--CoA ligase family protein [Lentimicrobium sp.]|nr:fatty acid--CoA ligase family protein [Lentimicrobium sp.]